MFGTKRLPAGKSTILALAALLGASQLPAQGAEPVGIQLTVANIGQAPLRSMVVRVTGRAYPIEEIAPGGRAALVIVPTGESDVELAFPNQKRFKVNAYLNARSRGRMFVQVTPQGLVSERSEGLVTPLY